MNKLYTKGDDIDTELRPKFNFILKGLSSINDLSDVEKKLKSPLNPLLSPEKLENLVKKVPEGTKLKKTNVRDFLRNEIGTFNDKQIELKNLVDEVWTEVIVDVSKRVDDLFLKSFAQWEKNSVDINHMENVLSNINDAMVEFNQLNEKFGRQLEAMHTSSVSIEKDISSSAMVFNKLLKQPKLTPNIIIEKIVPITSVIFQKQARFESIIRKANALTKEFNNRRMIWAEYVIGMRETLSAKRKLVKPHKKIISTKILAKLGVLCGNDEKKSQKKK